MCFGNCCKPGLWAGRHNHPLRLRDGCYPCCATWLAPTADRMSVPLLSMHLSPDSACRFDCKLYKVPTYLTWLSQWWLLRSQCFIEQVPEIVMSNFCFVLKKLIFLRSIFLWSTVYMLCMLLLYVTEPAGARRWLRRLMALPLVPVARIPAVFNAVVLAAPQIPEAQALHRYMTATWIDQQSLFPPDVWNTYAIVSILLNTWTNRSRAQ